MRTMRTTRTIRTITRTTNETLLLVENARFFIPKPRGLCEGEDLRPTPKETKFRILKKLCSGETYRSVGKNEGCSTSTVNKIFDEFVGYAAVSSLEEAAENYDVREEIEILREIACEARKTTSSFPDLLGGARLLLLLKKLGLSPVHLEDTIKALDKHKEVFGDFVQSALRLASLEEETGKTYNDIIMEYENTKKNIAIISEEEKGAKKKIKSLDERSQARESQLKQLDERAQKAQKVLDEFDRTNIELQSYDIGYGDLNTVKNFLNNIQKLKGNATKAVQIIQEAGSLENKLHQLKAEIRENQGCQSAEKLIHERVIEKLETTKQVLEKEIGKKEDESERVRGLVNEEMGKLENLWKKRQALELQVDGLQKMLAERLGVQPDIDIIYETLPDRKNELKELEEKIENKKPILSIAANLESLLQKNPADRKVLINWLKFGGISKEFSSTDEWARRTMNEILAKDNYVPKTDLDLARIDFQREIKKAQEDAEREKNLAQRRLEELEKCGNLLRRAHEAIEKQKNEKLDKEIASFIVSVQSHL